MNQKKKIPKKMEAKRGLEQIGSILTHLKFVPYAQ